MCGCLVGNDKGNDVARVLTLKGAQGIKKKYRGSNFSVRAIGVEGLSNYVIRRLGKDSGPRCCHHFIPENCMFQYFIPTKSPNAYRC